MIKEEIEDECIYDKETGGCTTRRPDFLFDKYTHCVIIENDEEQHNRTQCDVRRSMEIFQNLNNRPLVMIRFNPDNYTKKSVKVKGCFEYDEKNRLLVNEKEWKVRSEKLLSTLIYHLNNIPTKDYTEVCLFFDEE